MPMSNLLEFHGGVELDGYESDQGGDAYQHERILMKSFMLVGLGLASQAGFAPSFLSWDWTGLDTPP